MTINSGNHISFYSVPPVPDLDIKIALWVRAPQYALSHVNTPVREKCLPFLPQSLSDLSVRSWAQEVLAPALWNK